MEDNVVIPQLYYRYGKTSDKEIAEYLQKYKIVKKEHKGLGSKFGYYPLNKETIKKISKKPRNLSLTFDATETNKRSINGLTEYKTINYLVKSTSRFFLKPDIGEIFDQIDFQDLLGNKFKAICFNEGYTLLEGTEGEHFIMTATLLK